VLIRGPRTHVDARPDAHPAELDKPGPVAVAREPGVGIPVEVDLQVLGALVKPGRSHQTLLAGGGVLPDQEVRFAQLLEQLLPLAGPGFVQRPHDALEVSVMLDRLQLPEIQAAVPGQDDLQDFGYHVRLSEIKRVQERPGRGGVSYCAPDGGQAAGGRPGQVHRRAVLGVEGRDMTAVFEPDDRLGPGRTGLLISGS